MLVYGDAIRRETVGAKLQEIRSCLDEAERDGPWIVRHSWLVTALIAAGELAQGIADRAFEARDQRDAHSAQGDAAMELTLALARLVGESWRGVSAETRPVLERLAATTALAPDCELTIKLPEGFAHYALYPETYFEAARSLAGRDLRVVGIRSIGTALAAMVAAGAEAPCPVTVRPVGHPFGRYLALANGETLGLGAHAHLAIVDEGPGLSGSSIVAAAEAAAREGAEGERIHVFPSHRNGPGPQASEASRRFWEDAQVSFCSFDEFALLSNEPRHRLESWVADLIGNPIKPIQEISGGVWRGLSFSERADWPPAHPWQERRKFLVETGSGKWLLKFAGLGRIGSEKLARTQALAQAGFSPQVLGFRHGFLIERWHEEARPLDPFGPDRPRLLAQVGAYLAFRARHFPASPDRGASTELLFEMLRTNAGEEFGQVLVAAVEQWRRHLADLQSQAQRIETDNRLQAWEWLVLPDGSILKADAVDHHAGHDLVGCQHVAWDIAGASVEFTLSAGEQADLIGAIEQGFGFAVDRTQVRFATLCYSAFQLGYYREAAVSTTEPDEAGRLGAAADRYSASLRCLLTDPTEPNRAQAD
jgi:hypothetical protein